MCGRFALHSIAEILADRFLVDGLEDYQPSYNIAPSQQVAVILNDSPKNVSYARWGLIPHWAKDEKIGYKMINARSETVHDKPAFREAFKNHRCLILANGFYEWQKTPDGKQPYYISLSDGEPFAFAGIFSRWTGESAGEVLSCSILTTAPNAIVKPIHDRMPVILPQNKEGLWLSEASPERLQEECLQPYAKERMTSLKVSKKVNSPQNNTADIILPAAGGLSNYF